MSKQDNDYRKSETREDIRNDIRDLETRDDIQENNQDNIPADCLPAPSVFDDPDDSAGQEQQNRYREILEVTTDLLESRDSLGDYKLIRKIGEGGMGAVYLGQRESELPVAIKVLRPGIASKGNLLRRFEKEARMIAQIDCVNVTRCLEFKRVDGIAFLVSEYVDGLDLLRLIKKHGPMTEESGILIAIGVAQGLVAMHQREIIHRDIKPENIIVGVNPNRPEPEIRPDDIREIKLTDFGLARNIDQTQSMEITRTSIILGTPRYMPPEQFSQKEKIGPAADVYALGATLFHILAGEPPFSANEYLDLAEQHRHQPVRSLSSIRPEISEGVSNLVIKAMQKSPGQRYASAEELLLDLQLLRSGKPTSIFIHPRPPEETGGVVQRVEFSWELNSTREQLWPLVSHTDQINRALGLPAPEFRYETDGNGKRQQIATVRLAGMKLQWVEHPFEWNELQHLSVMREFDNGPFQWVCSVVELFPGPAGGTKLIHRFQYVPRGRIGAVIARFQINRQTKKSLDRIYRHLDGVLTSEVETRQDQVDPFNMANKNFIKSSTSLQKAIESIDENIDRDLFFKLSEFLQFGSDAEVSRIRPLSLARRWNASGDSVVESCLAFVANGILELQWDVICPVCRVASGSVNSLSEIRSHDHCEVCQFDYEVNFATSVELTFRPHASLRKPDYRTYCVGGPFHRPHVVAQIRLAPRETFQLEMHLQPGLYKLVSPQLGARCEFHVQTGHAIHTMVWTIPAAEQVKTATMNSGKQGIVIRNDSEATVIARVEKTMAREDALTAANAASLGSFRKRFPDQILSAGQLANISHVILLVTRLSTPSLETGPVGEAEGRDTESFQKLHLHLQNLNEIAVAANNAVVKALHNGAMIVFQDPDAARTLLASLIQSMASDPDRGLTMALNSGTCVVGTVNGQLEYLGSTVNRAMELAACGESGEIIVSDSSLESLEWVDPLMTEHGLAEARQIESGDCKATVFNA